VPGLVLVSTCAGRVEARLPVAWHVLKLLARRPWFAAAMRRRMERDPEHAALRSIADAAARERTTRDPEAVALLTALTASTLDRMALRIAGTENDVAVTRARAYPPRRSLLLP